MSFSENLQFIRTHAGVTQEQLAEQLNVSRQSVSKWESGASFPEMDTLLRICDLYSVDLDTLLRGSVEHSKVSDTAQYDAFMSRTARRVSLGVGAIIAAVGVMILLAAFGVSEMLTAAFLLLVIAVSVVIFVASGIEDDHFRKKHPVVDDFYSDAEREAFHRKFIWMISGGVGAILFGIALLFLFFAFFPEQEPYESIAVSLLLFIIAGAVTVFIYGGMQEDKYKIWKYNRDNNPDPAAKKQLDLIGTICGCIMLAAAAFYLFRGFTALRWGTAWWVFPVGGICCGIVSTILNPYKGDDD